MFWVPVRNYTQYKYLESCSGCSGCIYLPFRLMPDQISVPMLDLHHNRKIHNKCENILQIQKFWIPINVIWNTENWSQELLFYPFWSSLLNCSTFNGAFRSTNSHNIFVNWGDINFRIYQHTLILENLTRRMKLTLVKNMTHKTLATS